MTQDSKLETQEPNRTSGLEAEISIPNQWVRFRMSQPVAMVALTLLAVVGFAWTVQQHRYQVPPNQHPQHPPVEERL